MTAKDEFIAFIEEAQETRWLISPESLIAFREYNGRLMLTDKDGYPFDLEYAHLFLKTFEGNICLSVLEK